MHACCDLYGLSDWDLLYQQAVKCAKSFSNIAKTGCRLKEDTQLDKNIKKKDWFETLTAVSLTAGLI